MKRIKLMKGDNLVSLKKLPDNSIDSIVSDPPYGLSFMGKKWDYDVPSVEFWREVYRVLKPGGHILSFGGTRTYHRMVVNIEDAGFEIRDQIQWLYGSGFPKSHNIGKAVDKRGGESIGWFGEWLVKWRKDNNIPQSKIAELFPSKSGGLTGCVSNWELGNNLPTNEQFNLICKTFDLPFNSLEEAEREFIGTKTSGIGKAFTKDGWGTGNDEVEITKGTSPYEGWGTALKPANEPICVARKPLSEKSVAENVLKWGTGGINIDGCRVGTEIIETNMKNTKGGLYSLGNEDRTNEVENTFNEGRFPANLILDETAAELLDEQSGMVGNNWKKNYGEKDYKGKQYDSSTNQCVFGGGYTGNNTYADKGGASRFFYIPKVSKKERNMGLDHFEDREQPQLKSVSRFCSECNKREDYKCDCNVDYIYKEQPGYSKVTKNNHPTVKTVQLMAYLCRLITPKNGIVLEEAANLGLIEIGSDCQSY